MPATPKSSETVFPGDYRILQRPPKGAKGGSGKPPQFPKPPRK